MWDEFCCTVWGVIFDVFIYLIFLVIYPETHNSIKALAGCQGVAMHFLKGYSTQ